MSLKTALWVVVGLLVIAPSWARAPASEPPRGTVVDEPFTSTVLRDNRIGLNPERAIKGLLPLIDRKYRTLARRESRAVVGNLFGGLGRTQIFWAIHQAFAPNTASPPCYCDFFTEVKNGQPRFNPDRALAMQETFLLDESLPESAAALRSMRGLALDWGRFDTTQAHVISNRQFSRKLEDLGVEHEAEEYRGDRWNRTWTEDGRFAARVLPFLQKRFSRQD